MGGRDAAAWERYTMGLGAKLAAAEGRLLEAFVAGFAAGADVEVDDSLRADVEWAFARWRDGLK